jgi:hypothetical protein
MLFERIEAMKWEAQISQPRNLRLVIEQQKLTSLVTGVPDQFGYYLYVWENGVGIEDDLQDDLDIAIDVAFKRFQVPKEVWRQVE